MASSMGPFFIHPPPHKRELPPSEDSQYEKSSNRSSVDFRQALNYSERASQERLLFPSENEQVTLVVSFKDTDVRQTLGFHRDTLVYDCKSLILLMLPECVCYRDALNWGFLYFLPPNQQRNKSTLNSGHPSSVNLNSNKNVTFLSESASLSHYFSCQKVNLLFCPRFRIPLMAEPNEVSEMVAAGVEPRLTGRLKSRQKKQMARFFDCIEQRKYEKVLDELKENFDPNVPFPGGTQTPLVNAVLAEDLYLITLLIERGSAFPDFRTPDSRSPLHWAASKSKTRSLQLLLSRYHAHSNIVDEGGLSPLHLACQSGSEDCTRLLLAARANPNLISSSGRTPLHIACVGAHASCVWLLLEYGADPNCRNSCGSTPLHIVAGIPEAAACIPLLIRKGASLDLPDSCGRSPLFVASSGNNHVGASLLANIGNFTLDVCKAPNASMYYTKEVEPEEILPLPATLPTTETSRGFAKLKLFPTIASLAMKSRGLRETFGFGDRAQKQQKKSGSQKEHKKAKKDQNFCANCRSS